MRGIGGKQPLCLVCRFEGEPVWAGYEYLGYDIEPGLLRKAISAASQAALPPRSHQPFRFATSIGTIDGRTVDPPTKYVVGRIAR